MGEWVYWWLRVVGGRVVMSGRLVIMSGGGWVVMSGGGRVGIGGGGWG